MLIFVIFALVTVWQALKPSWLMSNALMQYIGERSFSTYLVQFAVVHAMGPLYHWMASVIHLPSSLMLLVFYVATTIPVILAASLTYRFIEVPGVNIGRRIIKAGRTGQVAMAPAE
jgi:peptidoglycan/LPS O-acetylase OafA/YrhL